jgi:hypothetical protein
VPNQPLDPRRPSLLRFSTQHQPFCRWPDADRVSHPFTRYAHSDYGRPLIQKASTAPDMRERMWKPANPAIQRGEQGVPRGDGGRIDAADQGVPWCQTHGDGRLRKQLGRIVITFDVSPHLTDKLVRLGWLDATKRADKEGVATAGIAGVEKAISQSKPNRSYPRPDPCGYRERQVWGMRTRSRGQG